jgi:hypothetical protein
MLHITLFTFFQVLLVVGNRFLLRDSIPLPRSSQRTHHIRKEGKWMDLLRVSPALEVNLERQKIDGLRRESLVRLNRRSRTRLANTRGPSRWRINLACGRPVRSLATRAQRRNRDELAVCKHLVRFHREEDMMETAEEKTVEEEEGWMELAEDEVEDEEEMVAIGVEDAEEEEEEMVAYGVEDAVEEEE